MRTNKNSSDRTLVTLDMVTFQPLAQRQKAESFFKIMDEADGNFSPEIVEGIVNGKLRRIKHRIGDYELVREIWQPTGFSLLRRKRIEYTGSLTLWPDKVRATVPPNSLILWIPASGFDSGGLKDLVGLGNRLYDFFAPCYGFIRLPWLPKLHVVWDPRRGIPGWGWVSWLGPEYADLVAVPVAEGISVEQMPDGGRVLICGWPKTVQNVDSEVLSANEHVLRHVDRQVLQQEDSDAQLIPRFRYLDQRQVSGGIGSADEPTSVAKGGYGPEGFTCTPPIRAILDPLEPDFIDSGVPNGLGKVFYFFGLKPRDARRMLGLLPPGQAFDSLESSPTFQALVEFGERFPQVRFVGYRIPPGEGECITLEGFFVDEADVTPELRAAIDNFEHPPDEVRWESRDSKRILLVKWG